MIGSMLLYGPPGCGKSLLAKATFGEADQHFAQLDVAEALRDPAKIKQAFEACERFELRAMLIENVDDLLEGLRSQPGPRHYLLQRLQDPPHNGVIIATARRPEVLSRDELGAFASVIPILYPDEAERLDILRGRARGTPLEDAAWFKEVAKVTEWWSGRDLGELVVRALDPRKEAISRAAVLLLVQTLGGGVPAEGRRRRMLELLEFTDLHCTHDVMRADLKARFAAIIPAEKPPVIGTQTELHIKEVIMGDQYKVGQAGAVGPGSHAHDISFNQVWQEMGNIDASILAEQLAKVRMALVTEARSADEYAAIGAVASAETEARKGNGPKALEYLSKAGRWAFDAAAKIGETVAAAAIKEALGIK